MTDLSDRFNRIGNASKEAGLAYYTTDAHVRNVYFVLLDGKSYFLNYDNLNSGEFLPEENTITLTFTTHIVTLKGRNLSDLFTHLSAHGVREIKMIHERYAAAEETGSLVTHIEVRRT